MAVTQLSIHVMTAAAASSAFTYAVPAQDQPLTFAQVCKNIIEFGVLDSSAGKYYTPAAILWIDDTTP